VICGSAASQGKRLLGGKVPARSTNAELARGRRIEAVWRPAAQHRVIHAAHAYDVQKQRARNSSFTAAACRQDVERVRAEEKHLVGDVYGRGLRDGALDR